MDLKVKLKCQPNLKLNKMICLSRIQTKRSSINNLFLNVRLIYNRTNFNLDSSLIITEYWVGKI